MLNTPSCQAHLAAQLQATKLEKLALSSAL